MEYKKRICSETSGRMSSWSIARMGLPDKVEEIIKEDEILRILRMLRRYYGMRGG